MLTYFRKKVLNDLYRRDVKNKVSYLQKHQWDNPEEHKKRQLEKLAETLVSACKVPYYSPFLSGVDINSDPLDALHRLPVLDKQTIIENEDLFLNSKIKPVGTGTTSGTTGLLFSFIFDHTLLVNSDTLTRFYRSWYGIELGDRGVKIWGRPIKGLKSKIHLELSNFLRGMKTINAIDLSPESLKNSWQKILHFSPRYIYGYATSISSLTKWIKKARVQNSAKELPLKAIICTSEMLLQSDKQIIKEVFDCPVVEEYGAAETSIISHECPMGNFHIASESLYLECVDDDGVNVPPGKPGHLIVTTFFNQVYPLLRYQIGDYGTLLDSTCPCGRGSPLMALNVARTIELIRTKNGKISSAHVVSFINRELMKDPMNGIRQFRVTQKKIDTFLIEIVSDGNFSEHSKVNFANLFKSQLDEKELVLIFEVKEKIEPLPSGKLIYFISELD